jgi:hypothetical protein
MAIITAPKAVTQPQSEKGFGQQRQTMGNEFAGIPEIEIYWPRRIVS